MENITNALNKIKYCGKIESYGALIAINAKTYNINYISSNISDFIDTNFKKALGNSLEEIFPKALNAVKQLLKASKPIPFLYKSLKYKTKKLYLKVCHANENIIIEIENCFKHKNEKVLKNEDLKLIFSNTCDDFHEFCQTYINTMKELTSYDRVMLYKFDKKNSGKVICETKNSKLTSFINRSFSTHHISPIIKRLYMLNPLRHIADTNSNSYSILTYENEPLDLTYSDLRSASSRHISYLNSINAKASLSMPIIIQNELWGLLVAHDTKASYINNIKKKNIIKLNKVFQNLITALNYENI